MMCSGLRKIKQGHLSWMAWEGFSEEGALELRLNEGKEPFTPRSKNFLDREQLVQTSWRPGCGGESKLSLLPPDLGEGRAQLGVLTHPAGSLGRSVRVRSE